MLRTTASSVQAAGHTQGHANAGSIIVLEFNELSPGLLDHYMAEGKLPNFKRFHDDSEVFVTEADVDTPENLEPWIQWYSLHTGLAFDQHKVFHLTDGAHASHIDIWQVLREKGLKVGNWGSMNCRSFQEPDSFFVPDAWCTTEPTSPRDLEIFQKVIAHYVQEYSNQGKSLGIADYVKFLAFLSTHGLRPSTVKSILMQLAKEKIGSDDIGWRRVPLLDLLYCDLFLHYIKKMQPAFSTFFLNSVAHYQHAYWRNMDPEPFTVKPDAKENEKYSGAILFGYQCMDSLLGRFFKLEERGYTLVLASALSQQPYLKYEHLGGHRFYRPHDIHQLLEDLGVEYCDVQPVMTHQYSVRFDNEEAAEAARFRLESLELDGEPVIGFDKSEPGSLYLGNQAHSYISPDTKMTVRGANDGEMLRHGDYFYSLDDMKSGCHHPDGVLWFKNGRSHVHEEKKSILDAFPTFLDHFGIELPQPGNHSYRGKSMKITCSRATAP